MEDDNKNIVITSAEDDSNIVVTKKDVEKMSTDELLITLKEYEGPGRTVRFQDKAMSQEKKKQGIPYTYDFSWGWMVGEATKKGIYYGNDEQWHVVKDTSVEEKGIILVRNIESKKKRTVEASEEAFRVFDELSNKVLVPKALLMTEALERFVRDVQNGVITFQFKL